MIDIADKKLWGNEAADDETPQLLNSYFVSSVEFDEFFSQHERFVIARAKKGLGKSALINELAFRLTSKENDLVINIKGSDLVAQRPNICGTPDEHIHDWMQRMCILINREIGSNINFALTDDDILLVEAAELSGYKKKNLLGSLLSRLKIRIGNTEISKPEIAENVKLLERKTATGDYNIWLLIDDIDATFINTEQERRRLSTFFSACRDITSSFGGVNIRVSLRTDVWASIRKFDESLDKVEQYIIDLYWSRRDIGKLLAKRIYSYEQRGRQDSQRSIRDQLINSNYVKLDDRRDYWSYELKKVFPGTYPWGAGNREPYDLLFLLGAGRPRWVLQLCRMASRVAKKNKDKLIKLAYIKQVLRKYSSVRVDDICREHQHQCPMIAEIVNGFSNNQGHYSTEELFSHIRETIQKHIDVVIDEEHVDNPVEIARFLFRAGVFNAKHAGTHNIQYYSFEEKPELLRNESNIDDGMHWTIHPAFRDALNIKYEG